MWSYAMPEVKHPRKITHRIPVWMSPGYEESLNRAGGLGITGLPFLASRPRAKYILLPDFITQFDVSVNELCADCRKSIAEAEEVGARNGDRNVDAPDGCLPA